MAEFFLRGPLQVLGPAEQERHSDADERVRRDPLPRSPAVPVQHTRQDRQVSDLVRPDQQLLPLQAKVLRQCRAPAPVPAAPESLAGLRVRRRALGSAASGLCTSVLRTSVLRSSGVCCTGVCTFAGGTAGRGGSGGTAAGAGASRPASRASRGSCRCPLCEAAELDQELHLDAADVVYRGPPGTVTAVGRQRQPVELALRVRHVAPDERAEVGEAQASSSS